MLDDTDRSIIEVLERDARTSLRRIAEEVDVSLGTVSNRVKKLEETGVIKDYRVILDSEKVGWNLPRDLHQHSGQVPHRAHRTQRHVAWAMCEG